MRRANLGRGRRVDAGRSTPSTTMSSCAMALALTLLVAGCGRAGNAAGRDSGGASAGGKVGDVLTIAQAAGPGSLDPAKAASQWYAEPAYDPLLVWGSDGTLHPGLATTWKYVGKENKVLELTLRRNVQFSDGSPLTARAVKGSLDYQMHAGGGGQQYLAGTTVQVTGPLSLRITSDAPNPDLPRVLTQDWLAGDIISPAGVRDPAKLERQTAGAGPYMLDPAATIANDHYTYVANPNYWNKTAVHYHKLVIRVIQNQNSALDALKTGQVDAVAGDFTTARAADSAGLAVKYAPQVFVGLALLDRAGKLAPPLRDVRVRRALNYAIDRKSISHLLGKYGQPTDQTVVPGGDGALGRPYYSYDPAKAKQLLAQAGYADGFTLPVLTTTFFGQSQIVQAIGGYLEKIGVKLKLTIEPDATQYIKDMVARRFPAVGIGYGSQPIHMEGSGLFLPSAATFNPFRSSDPPLDALYAKAAAAPESERPGLDRQIEERLVSQAWFVPATWSPVFVFHRPGVAGITPTPADPIPDVVWFRPAS